MSYFNIEGCCLKCGVVFKGGKYKSLCPKCLEIEFEGMENGDPSGYLYAHVEYLKRKGYIRIEGDRLSGGTDEGR